MNYDLKGMATLSELPVLNNSNSSLWDNVF